MRRQASISGEDVCSLVGIAQEVWGVFGECEEDSGWLGLMGPSDPAGL